MRTTRHLDIENWFTYHKPQSEKEIEDYEKIRQGGKAFALVIFTNVPPCEEKNLAIQKLREVVMMANAAIACNGRKQDCDEH